MSLLTSAAGAVGYLEYWPKYLCGQWEARAATAPETETEFIVERLEGCGPLGTTALVRLLAFSRPNVADAAHARLSLLCRNLRSTTAGEDVAAADVEQLQALADGLEEIAHKYPHEVPAPVADYAWDVLELTGKMTLDARIPMLARGRLATVSDQLLQRPARPRAVVAADPKPAKKDAPPKPDAAMQHRLEAQQTLASLYHLPTPPIATKAETAPAGLPTAMPATPIAAAPPAMSSAIDRMAAGSESTPEQRSVANSAARINPIRDEAGMPTIQQVSTAPPRNASEMSVESSSTSSSALQRHLTTRSAWSLLGDLQAAGTPQASAAAAELHRRGFSLREIEIGKHLTSPDPAERTKYAEMLPSMGIAVKPWLMYLSSDPDAEVRRAAVAIMATSNDPELRTKLRELAITDADEVVRNQAAKAGRPATMRAPAGY